MKPAGMDSIRRGADLITMRIVDGFIVDAHLVGTPLGWAAAREVAHLFVPRTKKGKSNGR